MTLLELLPHLQEEKSGRRKKWVKETNNRFLFVYLRYPYMGDSAGIIQGYSETLARKDVKCKYPDRYFIFSMEALKADDWEVIE